MDNFFYLTQAIWITVLSMTFAPNRGKRLKFLTVSEKSPSGQPKNVLRKLLVSARPQP